MLGIVKLGACWAARTLHVPVWITPFVSALVGYAHVAARHAAILASIDLLLLLRSHSSLRSICSGHNRASSCNPKLLARHSPRYAFLTSALRNRAIFIDCWHVLPCRLGLPSACLQTCLNDDLHAGKIRSRALWACWSTPNKSLACGVCLAFANEYVAYAAGPCTGPGGTAAAGTATVPGPDASTTGPDANACQHATVTGLPATVSAAAAAARHGPALQSAAVPADAGASTAAATAAAASTAATAATAATATAAAGTGAARQLTRS